MAVVLVAAVVVLGGAAVFIGAAIWWASSREQAVERQIELNTFILRRNERECWTVHFPNMLGEVEHYSLMSETHRSPYMVRRSGPNQWETRDPDQYYEAWRQKAEEDLRNAETEEAREEAAQAIEYYTNPTWEPVPEDVAIPLETAYQRYLRQG